MSDPTEDELVPLMRWIAGELREDDPELQELLGRRPELRIRMLELRGPAAELRALATETGPAWDMAGSEVQPGDAGLLRSAAQGTGWGATTDQNQPSKKSGPRRFAARWALAAAALFIVFAAWQPWKAEPVEPRGYLGGPLAASPVGDVQSFERFVLKDVPARAKVSIVVYDSVGAQLADWQGRGSTWSPNDEQRAALRAAGEIRWQYRVEDPVGGLRSGEAQASLRDPRGSD